MHLNCYTTHCRIIADQLQDASDASRNVAALPMYSVVNEGEESKPQTMITEY